MVAARAARRRWLRDSRTASASRITPYLTTSPRPARYSRSRQGGQRGRVDQHAQRLQERADHVLRLGQVDAHLAAHGAVDLGQERGGHLEEAEAPGVGGGDEAGQVADHAAADGHRPRVLRSAPSSSRPCHRPAAISTDLLASPGSTAQDRRRDLRPRLSATRTAWGFCTLSSVMTTACETLPSAASSARLGEVARADLDVVAPLGQIDADGLGGMGH